MAERVFEEGGREEVDQGAPAISSAGPDPNPNPLHCGGCEKDYNMKSQDRPALESAGLGLWCKALAMSLAFTLSAQAFQERAPRGDEDLRVFRSAGATVQRSAESDPTVLRSRRVRAGRGASLQENTLILELFDDVSIVAAKRAQAARGKVSEGTQAWVGDALGEHEGEVTLIRKRGALVGTVRHEGRTYRISDVGGGEQVIEEIDGASLPSCTKGVMPAAGDLGAQDAAPALPGAVAAAEDINAIDILVCYTTEAKNAQGGETAIDALAELAVLETNLAYEDSGVSWRLRLAGTEELEYQEGANFSGVLSALQNSTDGEMDEVHGLRDAYGADLVSLIVSGAQSCGIAYVMPNTIVDFSNHAFSVVARGCATGYYSFAHEVGHNLGCQHDRDHAGNGAFEWSYGYRSADESWRTIMAYAPGTRIRRFSNPGLTYQGESTGVSRSTSSSADNAGTIEITAGILSQYRSPSVSSFGVGKMTSAGVLPVLEGEGRVSVSEVGTEEGFALQLTGAMPNSYGVVFRSNEADDRPFGGGTFFLSTPMQRARAFTTDASGAARVLPGAGNLQVGQSMHFQALFRDRDHPDQSGLGLSGAVRVTAMP
ncbi:MAG: reprolysin-like metallopeptidase [Planctomycetota bacterium]